MAIEIRLEEATGNETHEAKIEENVSVGQLMPAIITALRLPITDNAGRPITYHLSHNNRRLEENQTLTDAEVQQGDTLTILPELTAGSQFIAHNPHLPPLVVLGPGVRKRQILTGTPPDYRATLQTNGIQVSLQADAMRQVWAQAKASPEREVGGILVGTVYEENGHFLVDVKQVLEAEDALAGLAFVTFTGKSWLKMLQQRDNYANMFVTGWYHSHPGFGIFLSSDDRFVHREFFGDEPWYLALVVDPVSDEWGVFAWGNGQIERCHEC